MMLSNFFIFLISLHLAIQGAKSSIIIDEASCVYYPMDDAVNELIDMAQTALQRTGNAFSRQGTQSEIRVVFNTFNVYFSLNNARATTRILLGMYLSLLLPI